MGHRRPSQASFPALTQEESNRTQTGGVLLLAGNAESAHALPKRRYGRHLQSNRETKNNPEQCRRKEEILELGRTISSRALERLLRQSAGCLDRVSLQRKCLSPSPDPDLLGDWR